MSDLSIEKKVVQEYYGKTLKSSEDLITDACCTADDVPDFAKRIPVSSGDSMNAVNSNTQSCC